METSNSDGNKGSEWPDFYPSDLTLPPIDSDDADGTFYRLVNQTPPQETCFLATHEEQPNRYKKFRKNGDIFCLENIYGASFFNNHLDAMTIRDKFPEALGNKKLAKGDLNPSIGKMRPYPNNPSHFTVWIKKMMSPHSSFVVI